MLSEPLDQAVPAAYKPAMTGLQAHERITGPAL